MMTEFISGIKLMFKEFVSKETNKKQRANMWTFSRLVLAFAIPITVFIGKFLILPSGYITAALLTIGATITDFIDGKSARKHNSISDFGKKLDILADKVFAFMMGISLSLINPLFIFNIIGEAMISSINIYYQTKYKELTPKSSFMGKVKQWPLSFTFILGYLSLFIPKLTLTTNIFIIISFMTELITFKNYIGFNNKEIKKLKLSTILNETVKENTLEKSSELNKKEEYLKLRNILIEIKNQQENQTEKVKIKTKKR